MITPMPMPTPPMMWSLLLNTSSMAAGQLWGHKDHQKIIVNIMSQQSTHTACRHPINAVTVVMRTAKPSFLGQMSLAASITVPVGPQQSSWEGETEVRQLELH